MHFIQRILWLALTLIALQSPAQAPNESLLNACRLGDTSAVRQFLAQHPVWLNTPDHKGYTPLILAVYNQQAGVVDLLLSHKVKIDAQDRSGNTALMGATFKGYAPIVTTLLAHGADPNLQNYNGATALTFACTFSTAEVVQALIQGGADPAIPDSRGMSPLDHARMQGNQAAIDLLQGQLPPETE